MERVDKANAEGIFISSTKFATLADLDGLEKSLGKPIIVANGNRGSTDTKGEMILRGKVKDGDAS